MGRLLLRFDLFKHTCFCLRLGFISFSLGESHFYFAPHRLEEDGKNHLTPFVFLWCRVMLLQDSTQPGFCLGAGISICGLCWVAA